MLLIDEKSIMDDDAKSIRQLFIDLMATGLSKSITALATEVRIFHTRDGDQLRSLGQRFYLSDAELAAVPRLGKGAYIGRLRPPGW